MQVRARRSGILPFFELIDTCDILVFLRLHGLVTTGTGLEVNYALERRIPVYELRGRSFKRITRPVHFLSALETKSLERSEKNY